MWRVALPGVTGAAAAPLPVGVGPFLELLRVVPPGVLLPCDPCGNIVTRCRCRPPVGWDNDVMSLSASCLSSLASQCVCVLHHGSKREIDSVSVSVSVTIPIMLVYLRQILKAKLMLVRSGKKRNLVSTDLLSTLANLLATFKSYHVPTVWHCGMVPAGICPNLSHL